jgi:hypothetical protein
MSFSPAAVTKLTALMSTRRPKFERWCLDPDPGRTRAVAAGARLMLEGVEPSSVASLAFHGTVAEVLHAMSIC